MRIPDRKNTGLSVFPFDPFSRRIPNSNTFAVHSASHNVPGNEAALELLSSNMAAISESMTADYSHHREQLIERLDTLRNNERFCDVIVEVKGKEFKAHKAVLAASSPFFLTLLESNMRESKQHLIKIELEEATASIIEDVLKYVYTGNVSVTEESAHNLRIIFFYLG